MNSALAPIAPPPASEGESPPIAETVIEPRAGWKALELGEVWRFRELLFFFTWRDIKVRYKQTFLGAAWAVLQPTLMMIVFTLVLGRIARISSGEFPYPVFVYAGLLPWTLFATGLTGASNSVVYGERLITKVYFPRLIMPFAAVGPALIDFTVALGVLGMLMLAYGVTPTWSLLLTPLPVAVLVMAALGMGTLVAALNVAYRDFRYIVPFLVQVWLFATPTVYMLVPAEAQTPLPTANTTETPSQTAEKSDAAESDETQRLGEPSKPPAGRDIPAAARWLMTLNPLTGAIAFFRATVLGGPLPWAALGRSTASIALVFFVACYAYRRVEDSFADII